MRLFSLTLVCTSLLLTSPAPPAAPPGPTVAVPYRLSPTMHVMVRAKVNGKGPFNLVLDTGAPALLLSKKVEEMTGIKPDRNGWATADNVEIEGGVVLDKQTVRFEDIFQLEGMNGLGVGGQEIHGLAGYPILARFRIEYDFTQPKLQWTKLDYPLDELPRTGGRGGHAGLNALGSVMKGVGTLFGLNKPTPPRRRAFLGLTTEAIDGRVVVTSVVADGPSATAQPPVIRGDVVDALNGQSVKKSADFAKAQASLKAGEATKLVILRDGQKTTINLTPRGGL